MARMKEAVNNLESSLCETCLERGRERPATHITEDLQMCDDCFDGKPTWSEETAGERSGKEATAYQRQLQRMREWRRKNRDLTRERQRIYKARWLAKHQGQAKEV